MTANLAPPAHQAQPRVLRNPADEALPAGSDNRQGVVAVRSCTRTVVRMTLVLVSALAACVLSLVGVLLLWSRGKPSPFVNEDGSVPAGSISEKRRTSINGVEQGMFIISKDQKNPVLLFLHGGPGMPEYFLAQRYPTGLEEYFTVCWWDQRGAGLSYSADIPPETMTAEQLIADTLEVTHYLRQRFGQEKIYLMAHSGGSFIGIQAAARAPELYHAYIGVAQIAYQLRSEWLAYDYMLKRFKEDGDARMARRLERAPVTMSVPLPGPYLAVRDAAMHRLGIGTTRDMRSVVTGIFVPVWQCRAYTLGEKVNIWRGKAFSHSLLWNAMLATDLTKQVRALGLPVYFLHGVHDYTASYPEARSYYNAIDAPLKGFYTFEQSAHSPIFEEPERTLAILRTDVLVGVNSLSDAAQDVGASRARHD